MKPCPFSNDGAPCDGFVCEECGAHITPGGPCDCDCDGDWPEVDHDDAEGDAPDWDDEDTDLDVDCDDCGSYRPYSSHAFIRSMDSPFHTIHVAHGLDAMHDAVKHVREWHPGSVRVFKLVEVAFYSRRVIGGDNAAG